jgi:hypothetical protein
MTALLLESILAVAWGTNGENSAGQLLLRGAGSKAVRLNPSKGGYLVLIGIEDSAR